MKRTSRQHNTHGYHTIALPLQNAHPSSAPDHIHHCYNISSTTLTITIKLDESIANEVFHHQVQYGCQRRDREVISTHGSIVSALGIGRCRLQVDVLASQIVGREMKVNLTIIILWVSLSTTCGNIQCLHSVSWRRRNILDFGGWDARQWWRQLQYYSITATTLLFTSYAWSEKELILSGGIITLCRFNNQMNRMCFGWSGLLSIFEIVWCTFLLRTGLDIWRWRMLIWSEFVGNDQRYYQHIKDMKRNYCVCKEVQPLHGEWYV
jgi:hypothetical protein